MRKKNQLSNSLPLLALLLLCCIYTVGVFGFYFPSTQKLMVTLTPFNLLLAGCIALFFHQPKNIKFYIFCFVCLIFGFFYEVAGVNTGLPFGNYRYTAIFGWRVFGVPVIIAFNWLVLTYTSAATVRLFFNNVWLIAIAATVLVVMYDILLEPLAMQFQFWIWDKQYIPLQNYIGWFFGAILLQTLQAKLNIHSNKNTVAAGVFVIQIVFLFLLFLIL